MKYKHNKRGNRYKDLTGLKFNNLTVIKEDWNSINNSNNRGIIWKCQCDCGNFKSVLSSYLTKNTTKSCGCLKKKVNWKGCGEIPKSIYTKIKNWNAKKRGIYFNLSIQQMWNLFLKQNKKCYYTGEKLKFGTSKNDTSTTASLDRIDSSKGYVLNNVVWCHKDINSLKMNLSVKRFYELCKKVTEYETTK